MGPKKAVPAKDSSQFTVVVDTQILNEEYGANITSALSEHQLKFHIRNQLIPQSISFERESQHEDLSEEHILLVILKGSDVISWIESDTLLSTVKSYGDIYGDKKISLLIFGFRKFLRGNKHTKLSRLKIETELTRLQIHTSVSHRLIEKATDLVDTIIHFSKAALEIPVK